MGLLLGRGRCVSPFHGGNRGSNPLGDVTYYGVISKACRDAGLFYLQTVSAPEKTILRGNRADKLHLYSTVVRSIFCFFNIV